MKHKIDTTRPRATISTRTRPNVIRNNTDSETQKRDTLTLLDYYSYRISVRTLVKNQDKNKILENWQFLHNAGKLFQQYMLSAWYKVDANNLRYLNNNQDKLRVCMYAGLMDYVKNQQSASNILPGRIRILPSSHMVFFHSPYKFFSLISYLLGFKISHFNIIFIFIRGVQELWHKIIKTLCV